MKTPLLLSVGGLICFLFGVTVGYYWFESQRPLEIRNTGKSVTVRAVGAQEPVAEVHVEPAVDPVRLGKFVELDTDKDGRLNLTEFSIGRKPQEAEKWFIRRDVDDDGFISQAEFLPWTPTPRNPVAPK